MDRLRFKLPPRNGVGLHEGTGGEGGLIYLSKTLNMLDPLLRISSARREELSAYMILIATLLGSLTIFPKLPVGEPKY